MRKEIASLLTYALIAFGVLTLAISAKATVLSPAPDSEGANFPSKIQNNESITIPELFESPSNPIQQTLDAINSKEQAENAIRVLKQALLTRGDLASIGLLAPKILEVIPDNTEISYLYAIYLASVGKVNAAEKRIQGLSPGADGLLLDWLARASIAKSHKRYDASKDFLLKALKQKHKYPYVYNLLGQIEITQGQAEQAINYFKEAIKLEPNFAAAHSNLGAVYYLQGKLENALQSFDRSLSYEPNYCAPLIGRASVAQRRNNFDSAIADLRHCLKAHPDNSTAAKLLFPLYLTKDHYKDAVKTANSIVKVDPEFAHLALGEAYLRLNEAAKARQAFDKIKNKSAHVEYLLSFCDVLEGKIDSATAITSRLAKEHPNWPTPQLANVIYSFYVGSQDKSVITKLVSDDKVGGLASFILGSIYAAEGHQREAEKYWRKADGFLPGYTLKAVPTEHIKASAGKAGQQNLVMGILLYLKNLYVPAQNEFKKAVADNKKSFLAHYFAALAAQRLGERDSVISQLQRSLQLSPAFYSANVLLAEQYLRAANVNKAISYYEKAVSSVPDGGVLIRLALLYENKGEIQAAAATYRKFMAQYPENFIGYNQLAWLYAKNNINLDEALKLAHQADKLRPGNVSINDTLGWIYFYKKDFNRAQQHLQQANTIAKGQNPDVLFHIAAVLKQQGENRAAKRYLQNAFAVSEQFESAAQAKKMLLELQNK